jgi:HPt (histidine-containing phosphotransfer) domain-containing protein
VKLINKVPDIILPSVYANADAIKQIMINLIMNAAQAMKHKIERPKISLDAYILGSENQVLIRVTDNGLGVPEELHSKIFMPFFTTKPEGEGTGLGLSLAASMANDFGGYLTLDTDYDAGARFLLYIPIAAHEIVSPVMVDKQCLNSMHQILGDDFDGVISAYMGEIKSDLAQMDHAYLLKQWDLLKRLAHTFKGSSLSVCAKGVAQVCMDIEHLIKTNQTDSSILFDSAFLRLYASTEAATHVLNEFIRQP